MIMKLSSVILYLSFFVFLIVLGLTIFAFIFPFQMRFDFSIYLLAARAALQHATLYPLHYFNTTFTYPPSVLPFFVPFVFFRPDVAASVWNVLSLLAFFASIWVLLMIRRKKLPLRYTYLLYACVLILPAVRSTLQFGQVNAVVLFLILLAFYVSQKKSSVGYIAGFLLGIAAAIKLFPLFLLFYFAVKKQWQVVFIACSVFVFFFLAGTFGHWRYIVDYVQYAQYLIAQRRILFGDQSFPMVILLYFPFLHAFLSEITFFVYACFVGISFFFWGKSSKSTLADFVFYSEVLAATILIVMPYAWTHHLVFLLPLAWSLFLRMWSPGKNTWRIVLFLFFMASFFISTSFLGNFFAFFWLEPQAFSFHALLGLLILYLGKFSTKQSPFVIVQTL